MTAKSPGRGRREAVRAVFCCEPVCDNNLFDGYFPFGHRSIDVPYCSVRITQPICSVLQESVELQYMILGESDTAQNEKKS